jgi:formamidopyrimidine-DNA glycosylase
MPELPEVETVRTQLDHELAGATILAVEVWRSGRELPSGTAFIKTLTLAKITNVKRRAKLLIWELNQDRAILIHLKMTGRFLVVPKNYERQKHDRIFFRYQTATGVEKQMVWSDMRQFGYMRVVTAKEAEETVAEYGLEPLVSSIEALVERLALPTTRAIKSVLLDQSVIAGIGNIYADEACFRAGIRPTRAARKLTTTERRVLATEIQTVLKASLAQKGTSAHHYVDTTGGKGGFLDLLQVYGRGKKACVRCETPITRLEFRGRGTHFCPNCQH